MKNILSLLFFSLVLFLAGCDSGRKPARGLEDEIIVFADSLEYEELKLSLMQVFEREILTPQPEKLFVLKRADISSLNKFQNRKNIVFVAPLNSNSRTANYINSLLDSTTRSKMLSGETAYLLKNSLWAKGQLVAIISGINLQELEFNLLRQSENLVFAFQKSSDDRMRQSLYNPRFENMSAEGTLLKKFDWTIYVQADYTLAKIDSADNFVWLRRSPNSDMERWIFIHWIDDATSELLNKDSLFAIRNRVTQKYFRTTDDKDYVTLSTELPSISEINFNGRYALYTQGLWEMTDKYMGGPFVSYTFIDESSGRLYMIDGSIYAPKYYKRNLIQQVDVILQSFLTKKELSEERIETLLEAIE